MINGEKDLMLKAREAHCLTSTLCTDKQSNAISSF